MACAVQEYQGTNALTPARPFYVEAGDSAAARLVNLNDKTFLPFLLYLEARGLARISPG